GDTAKLSEPVIKQVFIKRSDQVDKGPDFERKLYIIRKRAYKEIKLNANSWGSYYYSPSLSSKTIVYKGMLTTWQLEK
ncbi:hypothetical protein DF186_25385, partial [Enterococcus hirae]